MEGQAVARRGRGGGELVSAVMLHGVVACDRQVGGGDGLEVGEERSWTGLGNWVSTVG
jgi:hypothetical protein